MPLSRGEMRPASGTLGPLGGERSGGWGGRSWNTDPGDNTAGPGWGPIRRRSRRILGLSEGRAVGLADYARQWRVVGEEPGWGWGRIMSPFMPSPSLLYHTTGSFSFYHVLISSVWAIHSCFFSCLIIFVENGTYVETLKIIFCLFRRVCYYC